MTYTFCQIPIQYGNNFCKVPLNMVLLFKYVTQQPHSFCQRALKGLHAITYYNNAKKQKKTAVKLFFCSHNDGRGNQYLATVRD